MTDLKTRALALVTAMAAEICVFRSSARGKTCADIFFDEKHRCYSCRARRVLNEVSEEKKE